MGTNVQGARQVYRTLRVLIRVEWGKKYNLSKTLRDRGWEASLNPKGVTVRASGLLHFAGEVPSLLGMAALSMLGLSPFLLLPHSACQVSTPWLYCRRGKLSRRGEGKAPRDGTNLHAFWGGQLGTAKLSRTQSRLLSDLPTWTQQGLISCLFLVFLAIHFSSAGLPFPSLPLSDAPSYPRFGLHENMVLHIFAGLTVSNPSFPHGIFTARRKPQKMQVTLLNSRTAQWLQAILFPRNPMEWATLPPPRLHNFFSFNDSPATRHEWGRKGEELASKSYKCTNSLANKYQYIKYSCIWQAMPYTQICKSWNTLQEGERALPKQLKKINHKFNIAE